MTNTPYYDTFVAQTPEQVLQSVHKNEKPVLIGVSLSNGNYLEGIVLDIKEANNQKSVCLLSSDEQVSFFNLHSLVSITVKQPKKMAVALSKGTISRPLDPENENLTVLQLKRWLQTEKPQLGNQIKELNIDQLPLNELNNRLNIKDVFKALKEVVSQITIDEIGQKAWQAIDTIVLQQADALSINVQATTLTISLAIDRALPKELSKILEEKLLQQL
ncbi:hypothetical protein [Pseudozobellia thermophila]|uniref:Uncharacterized protein n=1 Tax=Pseudozobellia thermophila TaxID=192903 RepID=A0A1M6IRD6_9FLAO|nr:hypothetical protein [Pseudozobellia thermophila]SHJ37012.1 hypothetical protein SAMN04488513_10491 [Pseudozobellia thermophila]